HWAERRRTERPLEIVTHFVGATAASTDWVSLLLRPAGEFLWRIGSDSSVLSFAKTPSGGQVVDLSALSRSQSQRDGHSPPPPAPRLPVPLRRPPPARPGEPRLAPLARCVQENGPGAPAAQNRSPLVGRAGQALDRVAGGPRDRDPRHRAPVA